MSEIPSSVLEGIKEYNDEVNRIITITKLSKELSSAVNSYNEELKKFNIPKLKKLAIKIEQNLQKLKSVTEKSKLGLIQYTESMSKPITEWLESEKRQEVARLEKYKNTFLTSVGQVFRENSLEIKGNVTSYLTCRNFKIKADQGSYKLSTLYGGDEEKFIVIDEWDAKQISDIIRNFYRFFSEITVEQYQNEIEFVKKSYNFILNHEKKSPGEWISIIDIMKEYEKNKKNKIGRAHV